MNTNDGVSKIRLSMLKGRPSNSSVPSINFRFNPGSDDLITLEPVSSEGENKEVSAADEASPDDSQGRTPKQSNLFLGLRSASLDREASTLQDSQNNKDSSSLISRITKTFEGKINEIRSEKSKDIKFKEGACISNEEKYSSSQESEKSDFSHPVTPKRGNEDRGSSELISPQKVKSCLTQDISGQTSKLKYDFGKNIRPKFSELRNRKSSKDNNSGTPKIKSSLFHSILGKDDLLTSDSLLENYQVDSAIEAQEDIYIDVSNKASPINENIDGDSILSSNPQQAKDFIKPENGVQSYIKKCIMNYIKELYTERRSVMTKFLICTVLICFILPIPRFIAGLSFGFVLASLFYLILLKIIIPKDEDRILIPNTVSDSTEKNDSNFIVEGYMNELDGEYFPESYHVSQTHTVLLRLQGSKLKIASSRRNISKHARPNEELTYGTLFYAREFDLLNAEVVLLPKNLPRRWLWRRKYPIFIRLVSKFGKSSSADSLYSTPVKSSASEASQNLISTNEGKPVSQFEDKDDDFKEFESLGVEADLDPMTSSLDLTSYEEVTEDMCEQPYLCLFARTDREKDIWFRRFVYASQIKDEAISEDAKSITPFTCPSTPDTETSSGVAFETAGAKDEIVLEPKVEIIEDQKTSPRKNFVPSITRKHLSFENYMAWLLQSKANKDSSGGDSNDVRWFNCFIGRVMFDFLRDHYWANKIQERVQKKLSKLHIPYFVGDIVVTNVNLGECVPQLLSVGQPSMDSQGLWVDLNIAYDGSFRMTLETKLDLMKIKAKSTEYSNRGVASTPPSPIEHPEIVSGKSGRVYARSPSSDCVLRNVQYDTDTDDSVESSSENDFDDLNPGDRGGGPASKRFLRIVDSVAASKYFQQASEFRFLQKAMQGVSRTRIELGVEVRRLTGVLALNIPPSPSDRLWYGFRGSPEFSMVAKPCLGDHQLDTLPFLADFIQKHLKLAFEKVFVLPNMDDLVIPIMSPLLPGQTHDSRVPWDAPPPSVDLSSNPSPSKTFAPFTDSQSFKKLSKTAEEI